MAGSSSAKRIVWPDRDASSSAAPEAGLTGSRRSKKKVEPSPGVLSTSRRDPIARRMRMQIARPSPKPGCWFPGGCSSRPYSLKMLDISSGAMPTPVSRISNRTLTSAREISREVI